MRLLGIRLPVFALVVLAATLAMLAAYSGRSTAAGGASRAEPQQVIKQTEVMKLFFDPYYVDLRRSIRQEPEDRSDWRSMYVATYRLAEATNLLYFREGKEYLESDEWNAAVAESQQILLELGDAVTKLDYPQAKDHYARLIKACNECHVQFEPRKPTAVEP